MAAKQAFTRSKFYGLNYRDSGFATGSDSFNKFHEANNIQNIRLNPEDGISVRPGRVQIGTLADVGRSCFWWDNDLYISTDSSIYKDDGAGGTPGVVKALGSAPVTPFWAGFTRQLWYADGANIPQKTADGATWNRLGVAQPAAAPVVAINAAVGLLNGFYTYYYVYLHKNAGIGYEVESRVTAALLSNEINPVNQQADIPVIASTDPQVNFIRIYRISSVAAEWQRVAEIANATGTYTDNIADAALGPVPDFPKEGEPFDYLGNPIILQGVCVWKNRLWGWADGYLYPTRVGRPEKFFSDGNDCDFQPFEVFPEQKNAKITRVVPFKNMLLAFSKDNFVAFVGDAEPFAAIDYYYGIGCPSPKSFAIVNGILFWLSDSGVYAWNGIDDPVPMSQKIDHDSLGTDRGIMDGSDLSLSVAAGIYVAKKKEYWLSVQEGSSASNTRTFVYNVEVAQKTNLSPWSKYTFGFGDAVQIDERNIVTLTGGNVGYNKELQGTQDFGVNVLAEYETRAWDFGTMDFAKCLFYVNAIGYTAGTDAITFTTIPNNSAVAPDSFTLSTISDTWDANTHPPSTDYWGTDPPTDPTDFWGGNIQTDRMLSYPQTMVDTSFGFKVNMQGDALFYNFGIQYGLKGRKRA